MRIFNFASVALCSFCFVLSGVSFANEKGGYTGLPNTLTGGNVKQKDAIGDIANKTESGVRFSREAVSQQFDIVRPAQEKPAQKSETSSEVDADNKDAVVDDGYDHEDEYLAAENEGAESSFVEIEFDTDAYNIISKNSNGYAYINGDTPGTYIVKVPPLLYSKIELPFKAAYDTPFVESVVINQREDVLLVAPRGNIPINLVLYHPERPTVSVSLVLLPDPNEIPATVKISFNENRLPASKKDESKLGEMVGDHRVSILSNINANKVANYDRSDSHVDLMRKISTDVALGYVPDGYSLRAITEGPTGALCGDKRLLGKYTQNIVGSDFEIDVFRVRNAGSDYVEFKERNCYRSGVSSIFFNPTNALAPGVEAELIIIHSIKSDAEDSRLRRPSYVSPEL